MKEKNIKKTEEIARDIIELTDSLDSQQELKDAWSVLNYAMRYLSSKDDYLTSKRRTMEMIVEMEYATQEEGN